MGAPALLLDRYAGRLEYHDPWHRGREVSHLFRGLVDAREVDALLQAEGLGALRLVDNGGVHRRSPDLVGLDDVRAYHLVPRGASKGNAVARHMRARMIARRTRSPSAIRARISKPPTTSARSGSSATP